jgi:TolB protein
MRYRSLFLGCVLLAGVLSDSAQLREAGDDTLSQNDPPPCATPEQLSSLLSGTIVYEGDPVEGEDANRSFDVWVIGAPDWTTKLVVGDPGFDGHPAWSPDGQRIVYSAHGQQNPDLFVINPDGSNRIRLTTAEGRDDYPTWFPEGIVYRSATGSKVIDVQSRIIRPYEVLGPEIEGFSWSPDRTRVVFSQRLPAVIERYRLFLAAMDGTVIRELPSEHARAIQPHWSPVDNRIIYTAGSGGRTGDFEVYVLDLDSGTNEQLTVNPGVDWASGWSPDGEWVLISSEYGGNWDVYAMRPDGTDRIRITCHRGVARGPSWTSAEPLVNAAAQ